MAGFPPREDSMNNHFAYLIDDDSRTFFQKVAEERAVSSLPQPKPTIALETVKVASLVDPQGAFEKVAARLDADIEIIKIAGPRGVNMGATDRAMNYMSRLECDPEITDEQYLQIFDKVAFAALDADFEEVRANFHLIAPPEQHDEIDATLGKIACQHLLEFAEEWGDCFGMDKEAVEVVALRNLIRTGKATARIRSGAKVHATLKAGGRTISKPVVSAAGKSKAYQAGQRTRAAVKKGRIGDVTHRAREVGRAVRSFPQGVRAAWRRAAFNRTSRALAREEASLATRAAQHKASGSMGKGMASSQIRAGKERVSKLTSQKATRRERYKDVASRRPREQIAAAKGRSEAKREAARAAKPPAAAEGGGAAAKRTEAGAYTRGKGKRKVDTSSPAAARETVATAKKEGWWASLSDEEKKRVGIAAGAGYVAANVLGD